MKIVFIVLLAQVLVLNSCKKESMISGDDQISTSSFVSMKFSEPKTIPGPFLQIQCIHSFKDLITILRNDRASAVAVILENGVIIALDNDIRSITYTAQAQEEDFSLFRSKLEVEWREPAGNWQWNIGNAWSLGCVFTNSGIPPFTNLLKGRDIIEIRTSFIWEIGIYAGERIAYVIIG